MQSLQPLPRSFYEQDTHKVATELLGKILVRKINGATYLGRICEVECYIGEDDLASHASKGKTKRTEIMYGDAGHAYIYLIYGMYNCLNIVTEARDFPAAILIRAVDTITPVTGKTDGPGKLCREFFIDRALNGHNITKKGELFITDDGLRISKKNTHRAPRIEVAYAQEDALLPWRYFYSK